MQNEQKKDLATLIQEVNDALGDTSAPPPVATETYFDDGMDMVESDEFLPPEFSPEEIAEQDALLAEAMEHGRQRAAGQCNPVRNPNAVPFEMTTGLELAQRQLATYDPSFLAFAKAAAVAPKYTPPPPPLTRGQKFVRRIRAIIAVLAAKVVVFWHQIQTKLGLRPTKKAVVNGAALQIDKIPGIEVYLNDKALMLSQAERKSLWVEMDGPLHLGIARFASIRVPREPDGSVHPRYIKRWANFLNAMADSGVWVEGVLAGPSMLSLGMFGEQPRYEKVFFTFLYTKQMSEDSAIGGKTPAQVLNEKFNCQVFTDEGGVSIASIDSSFPW
jgi:hypothetical protein